MKKALVFGASDKSAKIPNANTGNMMHAAAARKFLIDYDDFPFREWTDEEIERARSDYSHIIYVAANGIRPGAPDDMPVVKFHEMIERNFEKVDLPIVTMGLGAQQPLEGRDGEIPRATKNLLHLVSERSREIAVRGESTASLLESIGVKNATVMGCQSCFWSLKPSLDESHFRTSNSEKKGIAFNYTAPGREHILIKLAIENGFYAYGQEEYAELRAKDGDLLPLNDSKKIARFLRLSGLSISEYLTWISRRFSQYYSLQDWMNDIGKHKFCFGSRFHGNMVALQAGVPSLWIVHDKRTEELCDHLGLPRIFINEFAPETSLEDLEARADYGSFFRKYPGNYKKFFHYLEKAGVPHCLPVPVN